MASKDEELACLRTQAAAADALREQNKNVRFVQSRMASWGICMLAR